ncbi:MAG: transglutaminase domain-containing protein [Calditrichaeota bacterium]|nr:transglutaminase domain-containing protein [Calditrichota bacterium]RQV98108.1 MAG: transglutaminase domain-containing protein [Calditrichota bacterium]
MNIKTVMVFLLLLWSVSVAQELVISGEQASTVHFKLEQNITIPDGLKEISVSFVEPVAFHSPTFSQKIQKLEFAFNPNPDLEENRTDDSGNIIREFIWKYPAIDLFVSTFLEAVTRVELDSIKSTSPFPVSLSSENLIPYLEETDLVQADHPEILKQSTELVSGCNTQMEAVRSILHFVVELLHYTLVPEKFDALTALRSGKGNCQNYSHLSAALLRAAGIPVRIINGITFKKDYIIPVGESEYSFEMADGRHSWIEVYFPDTGWLPFDPQQSEYFVSSRYLRIETGRDNDFTIHDGLVKWTGSGGSGGSPPALEEIISSEFVADRVLLKNTRKIAGLKRLLLTPPVLTRASEQPVIPPYYVPTKPGEFPTPPDSLSPEKSKIDFTRLDYDKPFEYGNLEFPEKFDFLAATIADVSTGKATGEIRRNFIVETAEYVTGKKRFAQVFILDQPIRLETISAALHFFGGSGLLWLELSEDSDGKPSSEVVTSARVITERIPVQKGYDWISFDFSREGLILSPGRYWISLEFSGSPIVNWFYTYGKPVGPVDGTRSTSPPEFNWNTIQTYEFNYRVKGKEASDPGDN